MHSLRSLGTSVLEDAIAEYDRTFGKQPTKSGSKPTCDKAFAELLVANHVRTQTTVDRHASEWNEWASPVIGSKRVCDVDSDDIVRVLTRARTTPSKRTGEIRENIYNLEKAMKLFFRLAKEKGYYANENPVKLIGEDDKVGNPTGREVRPDRVFRRAEFELIAARMDPNPGRYGTSRYGDKSVNIYKHQTIALVGGEIGARISELLALQLDDFFVDRGHRIVSIERQLRKKADGFVPEDRSTWFTVLKGKKGRIGDLVRDVWLSDLAVEVLDAYIARGLEDRWLREGGLLFPNFKFRPLVPGHVGTWLSGAAERAGLRTFTSHDFRHTFISEALEAGVPVTDIALDTGHDPEMIKRVYGDMVDRLAHYERMQARRPRRAADDNVVELARHRDRVAR